MSAKIIDGRVVSAYVRETIKKETAEFAEKTGVTPGLAVILVGENPASQVYVRNKHRACGEVGFLSEVFTLPAETTEDELLALLSLFLLPMQSGQIIQDHIFRSMLH